MVFNPHTVDWDSLDSRPSVMETGRPNMFFAQQDAMFKDLIENTDIVKRSKASNKAKKEKSKKEPHVPISIVI